MAKGATASGWQLDARQADASYGTMVGDALKMERDIKQMERDFEDREAARETVSAAHAGVQFRPGKPMANPNR